MPRSQRGDPYRLGIQTKKTRHAGNSIAYHVWVLGLVWVSNVYPVYDTIFLIYRSRNGYQQLIKHIDVMFFLGKYGWNHQLDTINSNSIGSGIGMGRMINPQIYTVIFQFANCKRLPEASCL